MSDSLTATLTAAVASKASLSNAAAAVPPIAPITQSAPSQTQATTLAASGVVVASTTAPTAIAGAPDANALATLRQKAAQAHLASLKIDRYTPELQELLVQLLETGTTLTRTTLTDVLTYVVEMGPGQIVNAKIGAPKQVALFNSLQNAINNGDGEFRLLFSAILRIVLEERNGAFLETRAFRFFPDIALSKTNRQSFRNLLHVMITLANPSGRETALRQINFNEAFQPGLTPAGRQRITSYFKG